MSALARKVAESWVAGSCGLEQNICKAILQIFAKLFYCHTITIVTVVGKSEMKICTKRQETKEN